MGHSYKQTVKHRVAYFVSPHGFGHAARAASVMEALSGIDPPIRFDIFTKVPSWFFEDSLSVPFAHHPLLTDIGMVQRTPLQEDVGKTIERLNQFLPYDPSLIDDLAEQLKGLKCELVICDIAPMGILAAKKAGMPSILVENFTWDWIYEGYADLDQDMKNHVAYLRSIYASVTHHIQTEPVCLPGNPDLRTAPVSRKVRTPGKEIRKQLNIPRDRKTVLITMGGTRQEYPFAEELRSQSHVSFIVPGASQSVELIDNLVLLPHHSDFYHPDLVNASDAVIGKLGYSTLAEVFHTGVPFGYIARPHFRESKTLAGYVEKNMPSVAIEEADFHNNSWLSQLPELLAPERAERIGPCGSEEIGTYISQLLKDGS